MKANFDSSVSLELNSIFESGEDNLPGSSADEGSRTKNENPSSSSPRSHSHQVAFPNKLPFSGEESGLE